MTSIGVYGGTFDPVHNGHLRAAIEASEQCRFDAVHLVPVKLPNHREPPLASAEDRAEMLRLAVREPLRLDTIELERDGVSYTVDTLESLAAAYPDCGLNLILGLDAFNGLEAWHRPERVFELANLVVVSRPEAVPEFTGKLKCWLENRRTQDVASLRDSRAGCVCFIDIPPMPIASSDIRARIRRGQRVRHLVPESVDDYIVERGLYQT